MTVKVAEPLALPPAPEQVNVYVSVPAAVGVSVAVPLVGSVPLHAPLAVQAVALVEDQVSVALPPSVMVAGSTARVTVGAGAALTVKVAVPFTLPPAPVQVSM